MTHQWFSQARSIEGSSYNLHTLLILAAYFVFLKWYSILLGSQEYRQTPNLLGHTMFHQIPFLRSWDRMINLVIFFWWDFMAPKSKQYISIMNPQKRKLEAGNLLIVHTFVFVFSTLYDFSFCTHTEICIYTHKIKICRSYPGIKSDTKKIE